MAGDADAFRPPLCPFPRPSEPRDFAHVFSIIAMLATGLATLFWALALFAAPVAVEAQLALSPSAFDESARIERTSEVYWIAGDIWYAMTDSASAAAR